MTSRRLVSALIAVLSVVLVGLGAASPASADVQTDQAVAAAVDAFRAGESVFNDPAAENALSSAETDQLAAQVRDTRLPIYLAVLPATAAVTADEALVALGEGVGLAGIYGVIVGDEFRAGSTSGSAADLATQAFRSQRDAGSFAVLTEFVTLADERFGSGSSSSSGSGSGGGSGTLILLIVLLIGAAVVALVMMRRSRAKQAAQLAAVRGTIDADITEYGERLGSFSLDDPAFDEATRTDMQRALDSYDTAKSAAARMRAPADAATVTSALEDGRYALACVGARLAGQPAPERRPPCFVDPRHGPSVADVAWAPPGLGEREVPMCAACRTTVEMGMTPQGMLVPGAAGPQPYWQGGPEYGAYARGYYNPFGSVMTGVLVGTMLGGMWGSPGGGIGGVETAGFGGFGGGGSDGGWGDFGGGGGDFGGGDFGGGDF